MSVVSVRARSFILALFIRDDGERFLLGDNGFDFKDSQLHFSANSIENDEVAKQGVDGVMLAGQVRRASVQSFDGYVGDATTLKEEVEQMRRDFIAFFAKGHHFRVIYIDCNRNAWQRKGGYLVDAPEVKELWQIHPEYHVGLNFEDVNYYEYDENAEGEEILSNIIPVPISSDVEGGLVWDENGAVSEPAVIEYDTETAEASGKSISISDAADAPLASFRLDGDTSQNGTPTPDAPIPVKVVTGENVVKICGKNIYDTASATVSGAKNQNIRFTTLLQPSTQYTFNVTDSRSYAAVYLYNSEGTMTRTIGNFPSFHTITFTTSSSEVSGAFDFYAGPNVDISTYDFTGVQLELGSTATAYEPYQGQNFEVNLGKNLLDMTTLTAGYVNGTNGTITVSQTQGEMASGFIKVEPNTAYTFSIQATTGTYSAWFGTGEYAIADASGFLLRKVEQTTGATSQTFTTGANTHFVRLSARNMVGATKVQFEIGRQVSDFAPYFTPIELCKIGTYQDYIYKSGGKWYVHKEVGKYTFTSNETVSYQSNFPRFMVNFSHGQDATAGAASQAKSSHFVVGQTASVDGTFGIAASVIYLHNRAITSADGLKTWFSNNNVSVYFALATPTDTEITNEALVAQLDALLNTVRTYAGVNNIFTVTPNEQGTLEIKYYTKYQPMVVSGGYVWEAGGSGGPTIVTNESISAVSPVWTVFGPALNPMIENTTTGEQIQYVGMVGEGQTLVVDMGEQTARLDGLNVISNIVGEYLTLAPGTNKLLFSADSDAPASEIGWSEIVG